LRPEAWFVIFVLAVYRLSEMISRDKIADSFRRWTARRAAAGGKFWKFLTELVHCPLCIGVWLSLPAAYFFHAMLGMSNIVFVAPLWLGMAGAQYFLSKTYLYEEAD
jgi:hypothetical protein